METSSIWLNNRYSEIDWASNSIHIHICRICILQLRECNAIRLKSTGPIIFHIPGIKLLFSHSLLQCTLTHTRHNFYSDLQHFCRIHSNTLQNVTTQAINTIIKYTNICQMYNLNIQHTQCTEPNQKEIEKYKRFPVQSEVKRTI